MRDDETETKAADPQAPTVEAPYADGEVELLPDESSFGKLLLQTWCSYNYDGDVVAPLLFLLPHCLGFLTQGNAHVIY